MVSVKRCVPVLNQGNDDESYRLEMTSNFLLGANLLSTETPVMDAWDGEAVVGVNFPMPVGLEVIYVTTLKVINTEDSLVGQSSNYNRNFGYSSSICN